jgi:tetratricopeptide (TPR) repeat protein
LRGRLYEQQGDSEKSLADFATAQTLAPKSEQPYLGRAETNLRDGKNDEAIADCDAAVRLNPNSFAAYLCRAHAYIQMGKSGRAVEEISRASRAAQSLDLPLAFVNDTWRALDPKGAAAALSAVPAPVQAGILEPRKPALAQAALPARATPDSGAGNNPPLERMAYDLIGQRNFAGAFILLNRAIALDPNRAAAYYVRGQLNLWLWHHDQAIADLSETIRLNPAFGNAYRNRAAARRALGDLKQAAEDDRKADALSSNSRAGALAAQR